MATAIMIPRVFGGTLIYTPPSPPSTGTAQPTRSVITLTAARGTLTLQAARGTLTLTGERGTIQLEGI